MSEYLFLFDLDSTITKQEILPTIAQKIGKTEEMQILTEATMSGDVPFQTSFLNRVSMLSGVNVSEVQKIVKEISLNENLVNFIRENSKRCYIVTGNLDVWIRELIEVIGMGDHLFCSKADVENDRIARVVTIVDKELIAKQFVQPIVVIGDGANDVGMAKCADIAIGFGGVRKIAPALQENIDFEFYDDKKCADYLRSLL